MKKIKITTSQASLLDLNTITENDGALKTSIGRKDIRIAISSPSLSKIKERVFKLIMRQDPEANVKFFEVTGKIVGNVNEHRFDSIKRDIKSLDPTIEVQKSEPSKKLVKITKEQYNRIFATNLINEREVKGGVNRIDKSFKKEFAGKDIKKIKSVSEDENFKIDKPSNAIPKLPKNVGNRKTPIKEGESDIKKETHELINYLYRKSEELSPFWKENGLTYDEICEVLLAKNIIKDKGGKYELSKSLGSPQAAVQALEDELRSLLQGEPQEAEIEEYDNYNYPEGADADPNAPWNEKEPDIREPKVPEKIEFKVLASNYDIAIVQAPDESLYCFNFAFRNKEEFAEYAPVIRRYVGKSEDGPEYDYDTDFDIDSEVISNYVNDNLESLSKGEGMGAWNEGVDIVKIDEPVKREILDMFDKDENIVKALGGINEVDVIDKFKSSIKKNFTPSTEPSTEDPAIRQSRIVAKLGELKAKEDIRVAKEKADKEEEWKTGDVDEEKVFNEDDVKQNLVATLPISDNQAILFSDEDRSWWSDRYKEVNGFRSNLSNEKLIKWVNDTFILKGNKLINRYDPKGEVYEMTGAGSSGAFTGPLGGVVKREMPDVPVVAETVVDETTVADAGNFQYDAPGLANVGRNGEFKKGPKTKAEKSTQYPNGSFVKLDDCTKLNNNKSAQNGGCSTGAVDGVVKQIKTKSSIISPSLNEGVMREALKLQHDKSKNQLIVISDLEGKAASQETFRNKNVLKKAGFVWTGTNWAIDSGKLEIAKTTLTLVNKAEYLIDSLEDVEEAVLDSGADNKSLLKARLDQYISDLANATDEVALSAEIRRYLTFFSKFHNYSFYNKILIYIQRPEATRVGSYKIWQTKFRQVKKGAKAITILAPIINKDKTKNTPTVEKDPITGREFSVNNDIKGFRAVSVFDVSDTEAIDERGEVPETPKWFSDNTPNETADKLFTAISEVANDMGVKVTQTDAKGGEKGYSAGDHINISSDVQGVGKLSTMIHEIAHELMHWKSSSIYYQGDETKYDAAIKELQAESVSYIVLKHYGLPVTHHTTYLALWKANKEKIQKNLEVISKVGEFIIKKIDAEVALEGKSTEQPAVEAK